MGPTLQLQNPGRMKVTFSSGFPSYWRLNSMVSRLRDLRRDLGGKSVGNRTYKQCDLQISSLASAPNSEETGGLQFATQAELPENFTGLSIQERKLTDGAEDQISRS